MVSAREDFDEKEAHSFIARRPSVWQMRCFGAGAVYRRFILLFANCLERMRVHHRGM